MKGPICLKDYLCCFFLVQGSFKPLRHHCTEVVLLIPCFTVVLVNIHKWEDQHKVHTLLWKWKSLLPILPSIWLHLIATKIHSFFPFCCLGQLHHLRRRWGHVGLYGEKKAPLIWHRLKFYCLVNYDLEI